ncbi:MAG: D-2-hydroxyacid dehydrogenase [Bacilli bacterium]|nr:D-2-hydroxyacid dehydrogenase [Bacilli bacterium]
MKIFIEEKKFKEENLKRIVNEFKNVEITTNLEKSFDAEVIVVEPSFVKEENISKFKNLKFIQSIRAGFDTVNFNIINERNIVFSNARDIYSLSIAEDVIGKILILNRNAKQFIKDMENKEWKPNFNAPEIYKSTVGIIGTGSIAKEIAKRIKAFDTTVLGYRRSFIQEEYFDKIYAGDAGLDEVLKLSDYVILTVPLNEGTRGMINKEKLNLMKNDALLVNIARGEVVVQEDLITALEEKSIRGAALDVFTPEPLPKDSPLWSMENVFMTPHCSAASYHINSRLTDLIIENLRRYLNKEELLHKVN